MFVLLHLMYMFSKLSYFQAYYFYLIYLDEIFSCNYTSLTINLRLKKYLQPRFLTRSSRKLTLLTRFPVYFCISVIRISFSFKYMKTSVKILQIGKFLKMFTSGLVQE